MRNVNVTVFGDSIAKGLTLKNGRPVRLSKNAVDIVQDYFNIEINNQSCFGQTLVRLEEKKTVDDYLSKINEKQQNIAVISLGGNDSDFDWKAIAARPEKKHRCKTPLAIFVDLYKKLIKKLQSKKVRVYICALPAIESNIFFEKYVCSLADKNAVLKYLNNDVSIIARQQEIFNNAIRNIAEQTHAKFLDIRTPFLQVRNIKKLYCDDGLHPNEDGQTLIADTIINYFKNNP